MPCGEHNVNVKPIVVMAYSERISALVEDVIDNVPTLCAWGVSKTLTSSLTWELLRLHFSTSCTPFKCMGKIFRVEFQKAPLQFHTKYLTHTLKDTIFVPYVENVRAPRFTSSCGFLKHPPMDPISESFLSSSSKFLNYAIFLYEEYRCWQYHSLQFDI